jgi:hypothetical protein
VINTHLRDCSVLICSRPSAQRIPTSGGTSHMLGRESISATNGPMATDRDSLELFMNIVIASEPWRLDPTIRYQPWAPHHFDRPLKIAVQWWDGVVKPHPPMIRALREVSEACKQAGMQIVDWNCEDLDHDKGWDILSSLYFPDGAKQVLGLLEKSGEPILPLTKWITSEQPAVKELSLYETWQVGTYTKKIRRHDILTTIPDLFRKRRLQDEVCAPLVKHHERRRSRSRCHSLPSIFRRGFASRDVAILGILKYMELAGLSGRRLSRNDSRPTCRQSFEPSADKRCGSVCAGSL